MRDLRHYGGWALITGASAGIGREFARLLAARGVGCVLVARREERLQALAGELEQKHGVATRCVPLDLTVEDAADRLIAAVADLEIGIVVNNAGFGDAGTFQSRSPEKLRSMVLVNCLAPLLISRAFLPSMLERGKGALITVGSTLSIMPWPLESAYTATKAFDLALSECLSGELRGTGVDVIALCPSLTETEFAQAQGVSEERSAQVYRKADPPDRIAAMALDGLGRKPAVGPRDFKLALLMRRLLPRRLVIRIAARMSAGLTDAYQKEVPPGE